MAAHRECVKKSVYAALAVVCSACTNPSLNECDAIRRAYIVQDGRVILDETAQTLASLDLDLQFNIYHCSARRMIPPLTNLRPVIASQGEPVAAFLMQKMSGEPDDATILSTVELLAEMKRQGTYDIGGDPAAIALLHRRVFGIHDAHQRMLAQSDMSVIVSGHGNPD